jgi:UDP-3-O-[3-hydroxymyristoyl] glucosamine N-acyltransferase
VIVHAGAVLGSDGFGYVIEKSGVRNKFPQLGTLDIGDDVEIGANSTVDRGALKATVIGSGTKIDNLCHIGHNCRLGSNSTISALAAFASGTVIGDRVTVGGHVVTAGDVRIVDDVVIGGNSGIIKGVDEPGEYRGFPLLPRAKAARTMVLLSRLVDLAADIKELKKRVGKSQE